jgi:hypothetical protein
MTVPKTGLPQRTGPDSMIDAKAWVPFLLVTWLSLLA